VAGKRTNGQGSIYYRKDRKKWFASVTLPAGERRAFSAETKAQAQALLNDALYKLAHGGLSASSDQTVMQFFEGWLEDQIRDNVRVSTYANYRTVVAKVYPHIGKIKLSDLKPPHLVRCYAAMREAGHSVSEIHATHGRIHQGFKKAVEWELIYRDPSASVRPPRPNRSKHEPMTEQQVSTFLEANREERLYALWALLINTGLRIGEALGLRWSDLDEKQLKLRIEQQATWEKGQGIVFGPPKTKTSRRTINIGPRLLAILQAHRLQQKRERAEAKVWHENGLMFRRLDGQPIYREHIGEQLKAALDRAQLPHFSPHDFRRTLGARHLEMGTPMKVVQEIMGHSSYAMTADIYSSVAPSMHREAALRLDDHLPELG
jgi:integrase